MDLVFVIDSSGSIRDLNPSDGSYDNWAITLNFVADIINSLTIGPNAIQVGLVIYSNEARVEFFLNTYSSQAELVGRILDPSTAGTLGSYLGGTTHTADGIKQAREQVFASQNGNRPDAKDIMIVSVV